MSKQVRSTPRQFFVLVLLLACAGVSAQSPMLTVLDKAPNRASPGIVSSLEKCDVPKLPLKLSVGITLLSSKVVGDRLDGRAISLRSYRFNQSLDKVLPELERAGAVLRFEPPGDLRKQPVGTVWHGYNEMNGLTGTRELSCSRIDR